MFELKGKTALVTGGAQGIGKAISSTLAAQGAQVAIGDIDVQVAEATAAAINQAQGKAMAVQTDVTDMESVTRAVAVIKERFGRIDILVNNAGWDRMIPFVKTAILRKKYFPKWTRSFRSIEWVRRRKLHRPWLSWLPMRPVLSPARRSASAAGSP